MPSVHRRFMETVGIEPTQDSRRGGHRETGLALDRVAAAYEDNVVPIRPGAVA